MTELRQYQVTFGGGYERAFDITTFVAMCIAFCAFLLLKLKPLVVVTLFLILPIFLCCLFWPMRLMIIKSERWHRCVFAIFLMLHFFLILSELSLLQVVAICHETNGLPKLIAVQALFCLRYALQNWYFSIFTPSFVSKLWSITLSPDKEQREFLIYELLVLLIIVSKLKSWRIFILFVFITIEPFLRKYIVITCELMHWHAMNLNFIMAAGLLERELAFLVAIIMSLLSWFRCVRIDNWNTFHLVYREILCRTITAGTLFGQPCSAASQFVYHLKSANSKAAFEIESQKAFDHSICNSELVHLLKPEISLIMKPLSFFQAPLKGNTVLGIPKRREFASSDVEILLEEHAELYDLYQKRILGIDSFLDYQVFSKWLISLSTVEQFVHEEIEASMGKESLINVLEMRQLSYVQINETLLSVLCNRRKCSATNLIACQIAEQSDLYGYTIIQELTHSSDNLAVLYRDVLENAFPLINWNYRGIQAIVKETSALRRIGKLFFPLPVVTYTPRLDTYEIERNDCLGYFPRTLLASEVIELGTSAIEQKEQGNTIRKFEFYREEYKKCCSRRTNIHTIRKDGVALVIRPEMEAYRLLLNYASICHENSSVNDQSSEPHYNQTREEVHIIGQNVSILDNYGLMMLSDMVRIAQNVHDALPTKENKELLEIEGQFDKFISRIAVYSAFHLQEVRYNNEVFVLMALQEIAAELHTNLRRLAKNNRERMYLHIFHKLQQVLNQRSFTEQRYRSQDITYSECNSENCIDSSKTPWRRSISTRESMVETSEEFLYQDEMGKQMDRRNKLQGKRLSKTQLRRKWHVFIFLLQTLLLGGVILVLQLTIMWTASVKTKHRDKFDAISETLDRELRLLHNELFFKPDKIQNLKAHESEILTKQHKDKYDDYVTHIMTYGYRTRQNYADLQFNYAHLLNEMIIASIMNYEEDDVGRPFYDDVLGERYNLEELFNEELYDFNLNSYVSILHFFWIMDIAVIVISAFYFMFDNWYVKRSIIALQEKSKKPFSLLAVKELLVRLGQLQERYFRFSKKGELYEPANIETSTTPVPTNRGRRFFIDFVPIMLIFCKKKTIQAFEKRYESWNRQRKTVQLIAYYTVISIAIICATFIYAEQLIHTDEMNQQTQLNIVATKERVILHQEIKKMIFQAETIIRNDDSKKEIDDIATDFSYKFETSNLLRLLANYTSMQNGFLQYKEVILRGDELENSHISFLQALSALQREMEIAWSLHHIHLTPEDNHHTLFNYSKNTIFDSYIIRNASSGKCLDIKVIDLDNDRVSLSAEEELHFARCIIESNFYKSNVEIVMTHVRQFLTEGFLPPIYESFKEYISICCCLIIFLSILILYCIGELYKFTGANNVFSFLWFVHILVILSFALIMWLLLSEIYIFYAATILEEEIRILEASRKSEHNDNCDFEEWLQKEGYKYFPPRDKILFEFSGYAAKEVRFASEYISLIDHEGMVQPLISRFYNISLETMKLHRKFQKGFSLRNSHEDLETSFNMGLLYYDIINTEIPALERHFNSLYSPMNIKSFLIIGRNILLCLISIFCVLELTGRLTVHFSGGINPNMHKDIFLLKLDQIGTQMFETKEQSINLHENIFCFDNREAIRLKALLSALPFIFLSLFITIEKTAISLQPIHTEIHEHRTVVANSLKTRLLYEIERHDMLAEKLDGSLHQIRIEENNDIIEALCAELSLLMANLAFGTDETMKYGQFQHFPYNETFSSMVFSSTWLENAYIGIITTPEHEIPMLQTSKSLPGGYSNELKQDILALRQGTRNLSQVKQAILSSYAYDCQIRIPQLTLFQIANAVAFALLVVLMLVKLNGGIGTYVEQLDSQAAMFRNIESEVVS